jgi:hypothetical protein
MKLQKFFAYALIAVILCATLAPGFQQDPLQLPNPSSGSSRVQEKNDQTSEVKDLQSRITKLESKVALLEKRIAELQRPRMIPVK